MQAIQDAVIQGIVGVLVVLIGVVFTGLRGFIQAKAEELKARATDQQWQTGMVIAEVVVNAVEQVADRLEINGEAKLNKALELLDKELASAGIALTTDQKKTLIEATVKGMNDLKEVVK